jgi:hypothetical protein
MHRGVGPGNEARMLVVMVGVAAVLVLVLVAAVRALHLNTPAAGVGQLLEEAVMHTAVAAVLTLVAVVRVQRIHMLPPSRIWPSAAQYVCQLCQAAALPAAAAFRLSAAATWPHKHTSQRLCLIPPHPSLLFNTRGAAAVILTKFTPLFCNSVQLCMRPPGLSHVKLPGYGVRWRQHASFSQTPQQKHCES